MNNLKEAVIKKPGWEMAAIMKSAIMDLIQFKGRGWEFNVLPAARKKVIIGFDLVKDCYVALRISKYVQGEFKV